MYFNKPERSSRAVDGFDPHSKDMHCNDVSTYDSVDWKPKECEKCTATFPKKSVEKSGEVCIDVPSVKCDVIGYTECDMKMVPTEYSVTEMTENSYDVKECEQIETIIMHIKKIPECKDVTKHHCVTKWEILNGEKVWSGNDDCKEVTWKECKLVEMEVPFPVTEIVCKDTKKLPWMDCKQTIKEQITMNMTCTPKAALNCTHVTTKNCTTVKWTESYQEVESNCNTIKVSEPYQEVSHKKKCLLSNPDADLDTEVLQDLNPNEKYDGPIRELCGLPKVDVGGLCCQKDEVNDNGVCRDTCPSARPDNIAGVCGCGLPRVDVGGLCCQKGEVNDNGVCQTGRTGRTDAVTASPFLNAVKHLTQDDFEKAK